MFNFRGLLTQHEVFWGRAVLGKQGTLSLWLANEQHKAQRKWEKGCLGVQRRKEVIEKEVGGLLLLFVSLISCHSRLNVVRATMWRSPSSIAHIVPLLEESQENFSL